MLLSLKRLNFYILIKEIWVLKPGLIIIGILFAFSEGLILLLLKNYCTSYELLGSLKSELFRVASFIAIFWFLFSLFFIGNLILFKLSASALFKAFRRLKTIKRFRFPKTIDSGIDEQFIVFNEQKRRYLVLVFIAICAIASFSIMNDPDILPEILCILFALFGLLSGAILTYIKNKAIEKVKETKKRSISKWLRNYNLYYNMNYSILFASLTIFIWILVCQIIYLMPLIITPLWNLLVAQPNSAFTHFVKLGVVNSTSISSLFKTTLSSFESAAFPATFLFLVSVPLGMSLPIGLKQAKSRFFRDAIILIVEVIISVLGAKVLMIIFKLPDSSIFLVSATLLIILVFRWVHSAIRYE